jgi:hypothetical protein
MALPLRCAANLRLPNQHLCSGGRFLSRWLCHSDARQVSDLPKRFLIIPIRRSQTAACLKAAGRQVEDLPRIGVAQP